MILGRIGGRGVVALGRGWNALDEIDQLEHQTGSSGINGKQVQGGKAVEVTDEAAAEPAQSDQQAVGNAKGGQSQGQKVSGDMDRPWFPMGLLSHGQLHR